MILINQKVIFRAPFDRQLSRPKVMPCRKSVKFLSGLRAFSVWFQADVIVRHPHRLTHVKSHRNFES